MSLVSDFISSRTFIPYDYFIAAGDDKNAMIKLHSLKGAARTIGAAELGEQAYLGEQFYRGDITDCPDIDSLLADLMALAKDIKAALAE